MVKVEPTTSFSNPTIDPYQSEVKPSVQSTQPQKSNKLLLVLLLIVVTLLLVSTGYLLYQNNLLQGEVSNKQVDIQPAASSEPSKNGKNAEYKDLTFQYPSDWVFTTTDIASIRPPDVKETDGYPAITFYAIDNPKDLTVQEYDEETSKEGMDPGLYSAWLGTKEIIAEEKIVNGIKGYYLVDQNCEPLSCDRFSFSYNHKIYEIQNVYQGTTSSSVTKEEFKKIFDQVLKTLKLSEAKLNTYYFSTLDITFSYPSEWIVKKDTYPGDIFALNEGCNNLQNFFGSYLRNPADCSDSTINNYAPGLGIASPHRPSRLVFAGPTDGLGGGCPECTDNKPTEVTIKGKPYVIHTVNATKALPSGALQFTTLIGPQQLGITAGSKSVWTEFDVYIEADNRDDYDMMIKILESIK